jgi:5-enolpyruvylshikimate-3-phosphate synthase
MGAARLRIKESDRLKALSDNLNRLGIDAEERPDGPPPAPTDRTSAMVGSEIRI